MSQKRIREETKPENSKNSPVVSKCLAIVLIPKSRRNSNSDKVFDNNEADETIVGVNDGHSGDVSEVGKNVSSAGYNGKELLQDFKVRNKTCYWNPSLVESIKSLEYKGFVEPSTILVTGTDIHLENLRSAWGRRVLKAPAGFLIDRIGDVNGIQMQVIPQTQFMPLPDALCNIVMDLNLRRILATLEMVLEKLSLWYKDMTVPNHQLVINTLDTLIKERKVFHNGSGYFVVTPDTSRLHTSVNSSFMPTNASWLPYHPMYIPVFQGELPLLPSRAHMRSISCQVTTIEETSEDEDRDVKTDKEIAGKAYTTQKTSQSSGSDYTCRREDLKLVKSEKEDQKMVKNEKEDHKVAKSEKEEAKAELDDGLFKKPLTSKEKIKVGKEAKSGGSQPDREKVEKTSLFSKLFSRKKKDKDKDKDRVLMPPPPPPLLPPPPPPPPVASSCSVVTSNSGSDTMSEGRGEKEYATFSAQFPPPEWVWYQQQMEKHKRTESWVSQQTSNIAVQLPPSSARPPVKKKSYQYKEHLRHVVSRKPSMLQSHEHAAYMPMSAVSSLEDKFVDSEVKHDDDGFLRPWPVRSENIYESFSATSSIKRHHHKPGDNHGKCCQRTSEYGGVVSGDATPLDSSNVYQSVRTLSPVARVSEAGSYAKLNEPQSGPLHSTPFGGKQKDRTAYRADGHEARDRIYGPPEAYHKRRSRRSQHRHQRLHSFYSGHGSDISYEYKGRLPKRNSSQAQSRDSGVNCVGLGTAARGEPMYENTLAKQQRYQAHQQQQQYSHEQQYRNFKHLADNQTQFEITNATENTDLNTESIIDSTTNSTVYQGRATNEAYNSVVYQDSLTNEAYNSVVYGSMGDVNGAPSVVCHTISNSCQDTSEMAMPYNSLQSTFYDESRLGTVARPQAARHFPASQGSPDTLIVDVVGTASESEADDDSDSSDDSLQHAGPNNDLREVCAPVNSNPAAVAVRSTSKQHNLDEAVDNEVYDENGDEVDGGDKCACCKQITKGQDGEKPDMVDHKSTDDKTGSQPSGVPKLRERTNRLDSGFSSPRNPEKSADTVEHSDQSNSSKPQGGGASGQSGSSFPQLKHQLSHDSSNTHQSSNIGSSGHHSNSDACLATGSDHQSGSVSDNGNSSSGAYSGHRDCEQVPSDTSRMKHGCSLNSLKSDGLNGRAQQYNHHQKLRQGLAHHSRPASKHGHHYDAYDQLVRSKYKEHGQQRIPLHPNAMLVEHRPHHRSRPKQERSRSVDLLQSDSRNDLHKFGRKYHSKKYGLMDEFEVMGVL